MKRLRPLVLLVLLLTVPFQAALGGSGLLCAGASQYGTALQMAAQDHAVSDGNGHHQAAAASTGGHHAGMTSSSHHASPQVDAQDTPDLTGKCKICIECCSAVAPIAAQVPAVIPPDTPMRVATLVDPDFVSRSGDGLFRPPRTTSV